MIALKVESYCKRLRAEKCVKNFASLNIKHIFAAGLTRKLCKI